MINRIIVKKDVPVKDANDIFIYNSEALSELREKAVIQNAFGWQAAPIEFKVKNNPINLGLELVFWMDMTKEDPVIDS